MEDTPKVGIAIIGAGVIGLAICAKLSRTGHEVCVLEKNDGFGQEVSSRNSEVIHAGLYYGKDALKTKLAVEGNPLIRAYCKDHQISHRICGKLVAAGDKKEEEGIERLYENAKNNGVPDISLVSSFDTRIKDLQDKVTARMGLFSGKTGIIDVHAYMKSLYQKAVGQGVMFSFKSEVTSIEKTVAGFLVATSNGEKILAEKLINCAGLYSDKIAGMLGLKYLLFWCKGDYFAIMGARNSLPCLVYPAPSTSKYGLGVHATINLQGEVRLGPDTAYVDKLEYDVDPNKASQFYASAVKLLPWIKENILHPDTSGIRPKLQGPGDGFKDFVIKEEMPGFINLVGIESPGLTASLAIARMVGEMVS